MMVRRTRRSGRTPVTGLCRRWCRSGGRRLAFKLGRRGRLLGAVALAVLFGLFNLIYGVWQITLGVEVRRTAKDVDHTVREAQLV